MKRLIDKIKNRFKRNGDNNIDYDTMQKMLRQNSEIITLDVRTKDEFQFNHLNGAINVPLQDISESKMNSVVRNKSNVIIVYCQYGGRSKKAVDKLMRLGYENVYNLNGGIENI